MSSEGSGGLQLNIPVISDRIKRPAISPVEEEDAAALLAEADRSGSGITEVSGMSALRVRHNSDSDSSKCSLQLGATAATISDEDTNKGNIFYPHFAYHSCMV